MDRPYTLYTIYTCCRNRGVVSAGSRGKRQTGSSLVHPSTFVNPFPIYKGLCFDPITLSYIFISYVGEDRQPVRIPTKILKCYVIMSPHP